MPETGTILRPRAPFISLKAIEWLERQAFVCVWKESVDRQLFRKIIADVKEI